MESDGIAVAEEVVLEIVPVALRGHLRKGRFVGKRREGSHKFSLRRVGNVDLEQVIVTVKDLLPALPHLIQ